jgi:hypothetical protein
MKFEPNVILIHLIMTKILSTLIMMISNVLSSFHLV